MALRHRVSDLRRGRGARGPLYPSARRLLLVTLGAAALLLPTGATGQPTALPPNVTPVVYGAIGTNGWYVSNVTLNWTIEIPYSWSSGCDARTLTADTTGASFTCSAGNGTTCPNPPDCALTTKTVTIKRDATAPTVTVTPDRAPDANGWYNHALTVTFSGSDPTSGIASCSSATYAGPDNPNASVAGSCRDNAGNQTAASYAVKYDATPPTVASFRVVPANRKAKLHWNVQNASSIQVVRTPGLNGAPQSVVFTGQGSAKGYTDTKLHPGRQYQYSLTATDVAGNQSAKPLDYLARGPLLFPAPNERVTKAPLLVWGAQKGASYYNVILVRGRRVLSAWPTQARLQLPRAWRYRGHKYKLRPGTYKWFVWPGFGPLSAGRYGKMLGGSSFTLGGSG